MDVFGTNRSEECQNDANSQIGQLEISSVRQLTSPFGAPCIGNFLQSFNAKGNEYIN